ncbi:MAG: adenosine deaminase [Bryobacterales bacterium]|nr:adenosine deaminase [Bryobacteraceae bacterium]MDW8131760.1 adenosine deaminase [Bryobacterales bacterium]
MASVYQKLPKAELHLHLEGSLTPETLLEIEPSLDAEEIRRRYRMRGAFEGFLATFVWTLGFLRGPQEYALAARRLLERLAAENVLYAEITLSAGAILRRKQDFGSIFRAVRREAEASALQVRWILDAVRQFGASEAMAVAELAAAHRREGVVAFGIGGDELAGPVEWFDRVFRYARREGLHLTVHAGETGGPDSVRRAIELGAERIGHGVRAVEDPSLVRLLAERGIPLEICLSSNAATGAVRDLAAHPLREFLRAGVPVTLNTDDPGLFGTTLSAEYELAARVFGLGEAEIGQIAANAFRYAFDFRPPARAGPGARRP